MIKSKIFEVSEKCIQGKPFYKRNICIFHFFFVFLYLIVFFKIHKKYLNHQFPRNPLRTGISRGIETAAESRLALETLDRIPNMHIFRCQRAIRKKIKNKSNFITKLFVEIFPRQTVYLKKVSGEHVKTLNSHKRI